jgi:hypothetical protein
MDRYYDTYLPFLLEACNDDNPDVRQVCTNYDLVVVCFRLAIFPSILCGCFQAAVYGLGVCAEVGGSVFKHLVGGKFCLYP